MAIGIDDALVLAGSSMVANAGNGIFNGVLGSLFGSGGSSADEQMAYNWKLLQPQASLGGQSYQSIANALTADLNSKLTAQQSAATWQLAQKYATQLPTLQRAGMEAANINPILAYTSLGNSGSPVVGSATGSMANLPGLSAHGKNVSNLAHSAVNIRDLWETIQGVVEAKKENLDADVDVKKAQAANTRAMTDEIEARTAKEVADTKYPGIAGQAVRTAVSSGKDVLHGIVDFLTNLRDFDSFSSKPDASVDVKVDGKPHSHHEYEHKLSKPIRSFFDDRYSTFD